MCVDQGWAKYRATSSPRDSCLRTITGRDPLPGPYLWVRAAEAAAKEAAARQRPQRGWSPGRWSLHKGCVITAWVGFRHTAAFSAVLMPPPHHR
ncbi:hypothetical protein FKM82_002798 [Ascaphus truei]